MGPIPPGIRSLSAQFLLLIFVIEAKLPLALATMLSMWVIVYYASRLRVYGGTWSETIGRGTLLTILYFLTFSPSVC
jgi:hypothetical protein